MAIRFTKFTKNGDSTVNLLESEMDSVGRSNRISFVSTDSTKWMGPMDYEDSNIPRDEEDNNRLSDIPNTQNTVKDRCHNINLTKCVLPESSQRNDQNYPEINISTTSTGTSPVEMNNSTTSTPSKDNSKFLNNYHNSSTKPFKQILVIPKQYDDGQNDSLICSSYGPSNEDHKPKSSSQHDIQKSLLSVPDLENYRSKSFDGNRPPPRPLKCRTVAQALHDHDSTDKNPERRKLITNRVSRLNTRLLDAIEKRNNVEVLSMLRAGASPNATCRAGHISAYHAAAYAYSDALHLLLKFNAEKNRRDKFGRTPLHLAAWAGSNWSIALLLGIPLDLQYNVVFRVVPEAEEELKSLRAQFASVIDVPCELPIISVIPQTWKDSIEHKCRRYMTLLPKFFSGWTALHIASYGAHHNATRLLLAAGANPNCKDAMGQTPLDIAGAACYLDSNTVNVQNYVKTIKSLIEFGGKLNVSEPIASNFNSALHTAVELCSVEAIHVLLAAGAPTWHLNAKGNTPLHECVVKFCEEPLQVLAKHHLRDFNLVDVMNRARYTVLHAAIMASWIPGVCVALDAGASVILEAHDGKTAIHIAALKGDLDIVNEVLHNAAQYEDAVNYNNGHTEPPIFCAIRSGNLDCVQAFLDAGALLKMTYYVEPTLGDSTMEPYLLSIDPEILKELNMILHATAEAGNVDMLELLLDHDRNLENLLCYRCPYLKMMIPVEFAAYHNRFFTFTYLLNKTLERAHKIEEIFDHSRLLHIIANLNREELFRELIRHVPNAVQMVHGKGYYPLHDAARNGCRNLIVLLVHYGADLSEQDEEGVTAISLIIENISKPTEFLASIFDDYILTTPCEPYNTFSEISVDYRVLIPKTDEKLESKGQLRVLTALLKTQNRQNQRKLLAHPLIESFLFLKWITLSTYVYLIVCLYFLFVMSLSCFIITTFRVNDRLNNTLSEYFNQPWMRNTIVWKYSIYVTLGIVVVQELSCTDLAPRKCVNRMFSIEFWVKFLAYVLAAVLPQIVSIEYETKLGDRQRHLATITLVLAWLNIMILLSKTPMLGYYMQMFWKVSFKIIQILFTFSFLIIMFSFCFMVQFHAQPPFEGLSAAVVKTLVMMTSEFDYSDTFTVEKAKSLSTTVQPLRVVFVVFLIFIATVLMNLIIGVAVHDIQKLVQDGNIKRLDKQVGLLNRLEVSGKKTYFFAFLGLHRWFHYKKVPQTMTVKSLNDDNCCYPYEIKEALFNKAQEKLSKVKREAESTKIETRLQSISQNIRDIELNILHHISDLKSKLQHQNSCQ